MKEIILKILNKNKFIKRRILPYYSYQKNKRKLLKTIIPNLNKQLVFSDKSTNHSQQTGPKILIPYIETSHYILYMMLILAKALQLRGARIKFLYCAKTLNACERINVHNRGTDVCRDCILNQKYLLPLFGLDMSELSNYIAPHKIKAINIQAKNICNNFPDSYYYQGIDLIPIVNDSVTRFYYGGEGSSKNELTETRTKHLVTAMMSTEIAKKLHQEYQPNIVLSLMFAYSAFQPYCDYYKKIGVRTATVDMTYEDLNAIQYSNMDLYFSNERFKTYVNSRKTKLLNYDEKEKLAEYLNDRFSGKTEFFQATKMFDGSIKPDDLLKIDKNKRNIFLFSNVFWDTGTSQPGGLYKNIIDWVISTIDLVKNNPDCHLYLKPHPIETLDSTVSLKSVMDYVHKKFPVLPANVSIIPAEMKITTYKLFPYIDIGVVYNGTLGLEMLLHDIPVVMLGRAPYGGLGLCCEPHSIEHYREILLGQSATTPIDKDLAYLFAYFYFIKRMIPFDIMKPVYGNIHFERYTISSLEDLLPGRNYYLDHICDCILKDKPFESW